MVECGELFVDSPADAVIYMNSNHCPVVNFLKNTDGTICIVSHSAEAAGVKSASGNINRR